MFDTGITGTHIIKLDTVDSTNNYAAKLIKGSKVADGTVIMTYNQTHGRGQRGNTWQSEAGKNLTFSLILFPKGLNPTNHFLISKVTALALSDLFFQYEIDNVIKWPNDSYTPEGKIAGVLIENSFSGSTLNYSIIGIGINVNEFPQDNDFKACSMAQLSGKSFEIETVLKHFCSCFDKWYLFLIQSKFEYIHNAYLLRLMNFGRKAKYRFKENTIEATIINVEEDGKIILKNEDGELIEAYLKEISFEL